MKSNLQTNYTCIIALLWHVNAGADTQPRVAIASTLGDQFTITISQPMTGSNLDPNRKSESKLAGHGMNGELMLLSERSLKKHCA